MTVVCGAGWGGHSIAQMHHAFPNLYSPKARKLENRREGGGNIWREQEARGEQSPCLKGTLAVQCERGKTCPGSLQTQAAENHYIWHYASKIIVYYSWCLILVCFSRFRLCSYQYWDYSWLKSGDFVKKKSCLERRERWIISQTVYYKCSGNV